MLQEEEEDEEAPGPYPYPNFHRLQQAGTRGSERNHVMSEQSVRMLLQIRVSGGSQQAPASSGRSRFRDGACSGGSLGKGWCCGLQPTRARAWQAAQTTFPILHWLPNYDRAWLVNDIIACLSVTAVVVPQSVAFAGLAGLPPQYGLYTSIFPIITYSLMGNSRHLHLGAFAVVALLVATQLEGLLGTQGPSITNQPDPAYEQMASALSLASGLVLFVLGLLRLGRLTIFMSDPVLSAFTCAAAFLVTTSQINNFTQVGVPNDSTPLAFFRSWGYLFTHLDAINGKALATGLGAVAFLCLIRVLNVRLKLKVPLPGELLTVVVFTFISYLADLAAEGVRVLGSLPLSLPVPAVPDIGSVSVGELLLRSVGVAVVIFVVSCSIVKIFSARFSYKVECNQELLAIGAANVVGGFFSCFPACGALARTAVLVDTEAKTLLPLGLSGVLVIVVLLYITPIMEDLPYPALGAIIVVALRGLLAQVKDCWTLLQFQRTEGLMWVLYFSLTLSFGVLWGILSSMGADVLIAVWRLSQPTWTELGRVPTTNFYRDVGRYSGLVMEAGVRIFRFNSDMVYFNRETFVSSMTGYADCMGASSCAQQFIILDMSPVSRVDSSSLKGLMEVAEMLRGHSIELLIARAGCSLQESMELYGITRSICLDHFFPTIYDAASYALHIKRTAADASREPINSSIFVHEDSMTKQQAADNASRESITSNVSIDDESDDALHIP